jgi:transcriptional regulator with XRE-family HTH domain
MKNKRLQERRKKISKDVDIFVKQSFDIVDRIHKILVKQGKEQKDLAKALGKSESEISKWMTGTHNFTIRTLAKIEAVLGEPVIRSTQEKPFAKSAAFYVTDEHFAFLASQKSSIIPVQMGIILNKSYSVAGTC